MSELSPKAKEARRAYLRKWAKDHPEKIREYHVRHWNKVASMMNEDDDPKEEPEE